MFAGQFVCVLNSWAVTWSTTQSWLSGQSIPATAWLDMPGAPGQRKDQYANCTRHKIFYHTGVGHSPPRVPLDNLAKECRDTGGTHWCGWPIRPMWRSKPLSPGMFCLHPPPPSTPSPPLPVTGRQISSFSQWQIMLGGDTRVDLKGILENNPHKRDAFQNRIVKKRCVCMCVSLTAKAVTRTTIYAPCVPSTPLPSM